MNLNIILILIGTISLALILILFIITVIEDYFLNQSKKNFKEDLRLAVKNNEISWDEVKEIALTRDLNQKEIIPILKNLMREILTGRDEDMQNHKDLIKSYINKYEEDEPFEGIPNDIRLHLERLREKIDVKDGLLEPLTNQIVELLKVNNSENKKQRFYTFAGFIFGLLSFLYAVYISNQTTNSNNVQKVTTTKVLKKQ